VSNIFYAKKSGTIYFFAQGYAKADKDRDFFNSKFWRRQATGTVAEILGENELKASIWY